MKKIFIILLCIVTALPALAQMRKVHGTVVDASGEPVIGATIRVEGGDATRGAVTDLNGRFELQASPNEKLRITFIGFNDEVVKANPNIKVTLREDSKLMDEVVVAGYGTQKKATLTGAVSSIDSKEMTVTKNENVVNMLSGKIPGVRITQSYLVIKAIYHGWMLMKQTIFRYLKTLLHLYMVFVLPMVSFW